MFSYRPHYEKMGKVLFSLSVHKGEGTPSPSHNTSIHWSHVFSKVVLQCLVPSHVPSQGVYPIQSWLGGGHTLARSAWGTPLLGLGLGRPPPIETRWWYSPHWDWMGYPPPPSWTGSGNPPPPTETEQQSEYLLHGGRYASCVHAGGLSSLNLILILGYHHMGTTRYFQHSLNLRSSKSILTCHKHSKVCFHIALTVIARRWFLSLCTTRPIKLS